MSWGCFFLPTGNLSLLSPSKKAQDWDNETAWKRNTLSRNSKPPDLHIAGDTKGKMTEKRLQSQKSTDKIYLPSARKKGANRNKHTREKAKGMNRGLLSWGTFQWLNLKDFAETDMGFERVYVISVLSGFTCTVRQPQLGPCPSKTMQEAPRSTKIVASFDVFS